MTASAKPQLGIRSICQRNSILNQSKFCVQPDAIADASVQDARPSHVTEDIRTILASFSQVGRGLLGWEQEELLRSLPSGSPRNWCRCPACRSHVARHCTVSTTTTISSTRKGFRCSPPSHPAWQEARSPLMGSGSSRQAAHNSQTAMMLTRAAAQKDRRGGAQPVESASGALGK